MVRPQDVVNELRTQYLDNLTDPNTDRRRDDVSWVFTHTPHIGSLPTIQVLEVSSNFDDRSIGTAAQFERARIQVTVEVRKNNEYDFDADNELETATDGLDYLLSEAVDHVVENHDTIVSNVGSGLHSVIPDAKGPVNDVPEADSVTQSVDFIAFMDRGA